MKNNLLARKSPIAPEDTNIAIWTYINLFIGFIIIFLSGIATNPGNSFGQTSSSNSLNFANLEIYPKPMIIAYDGFNIEQIIKDIQTFATAEQLSADAKIIYLQVIGPYSSDTETKADGLKRAQAISLRLNSSRTNIFKNASTTLSVSNGIPINRFVLKITFASSSGKK